MRQSLFLISLILILFGCKEEEPNLSEKDMIIEALINNEWIIDPTATHVASVSGAPNNNTFTINFYENETGVDFVLGGDVTEYFTRGSFVIREEGALSDFEIFTSTDNIEASINSITAVPEKCVLQIDGWDSRIDCSNNPILECGMLFYTLVFVSTTTE